MKRLLPAFLALAALSLPACQSGDTNAPPSEATTATPEAGTPAAPAGTDGATAAGEDHAHSSPHGGTVKTAGAGHLELVVQGQTLLIYPLDGAEKAVSVDGITGAQVILQPQSGEASTLALTPMGDHLMATVPAGVTAYTAVVTVPVSGEARSAQFEVGLDGDTDHAH